MTASDDVLAKVRRDVEQAQEPVTGPDLLAAGAWVSVPRADLTKVLDAIKYSSSAYLSRSVTDAARRLGEIAKRAGEPTP